MHILIAPDSFKDALPSLKVCEAIQRGILRAAPDAEIILFPLADGGEGTASIIAYHLQGNTVEVTVNDPLFSPVKAKYFLSANEEFAFVEMAEASGLQLLAPQERNPLLTSSFGTGELIRDAIYKGVKKIFLGIGGSATNDCGMGMLAALGWRFLSKSGEELKPVGGNLLSVEKIHPPIAATQSQISNRKSQITIEILSDVDNPLFGEKGAAYTFARQKGAGDETIEHLDKGLRHFSGVVQKFIGENFSHVPGAGAAGGAGFGAMAFLGAETRSGIEAIMALTGFEEKLKTADMVITGEGKLDGQTLHGKLVHGICQKAAKYEVPVTALCGTVNISAADLENIGITAAFSILEKLKSLDEAIASTAEGLERTAFYLMKAITTKKPRG